MKLGKRAFTASTDTHIDCKYLESISWIIQNAILAHLFG